MINNSEVGYIEEIPNLDPDVIEVVYPLPDYQYIFKARFSDFDHKNITIQEAIEKSGVLEQYPEINLRLNSIGINSELKNLSDTVQIYDRIEIYRPLKIDPVNARRLRAERQANKSK